MSNSKLDKIIAKYYNDYRLIGRYNIYTSDTDPRDEQAAIREMAIEEIMETLEGISYAEAETILDEEYM